MDAYCTLLETNLGLHLSNTEKLQKAKTSEEQSHETELTTYFVPLWAQSFINNEADILVHHKQMVN